MNEQLELFAPAKRPPSRGSLFLAAFPDRSTAQRLSHLAAGIRNKHRLTGRQRPPDHFHVTLHYLGDESEVPENVVHAVGRACEAVADREASFEVHLDRVASFSGRPGNCPLVLIGSQDGIAALRRLHEVLVSELAKHMRLGKDLKFKPHLTLLYDKQSLVEEPVEAVSWRIEEIVLVRSEVGATKYQRLGAWKLGA